MELLSQSSKKPTRIIANNIKKKLDLGNTFYESLLTYENQLPHWILMCINLGEESGTLTKQLVIIQQYFLARQKIKRKLKKALTYPALVILASIVACIIFIKISLPQISIFYVQADLELPWISRQLVLFSKLLSNYGVYFLILLIATIILLYLCFRYFVHFRFTIQLYSFRLPWIKKYYLASLSQSFSIMLNSGLSFIDCLSYLYKNISHLPIKNALLQIELKIRDGESIQKSFSNSSLFPKFFLSMLSLGESSGRLSHCFSEIHQYYQQQIDDVIDQLDQKMEPIIMLFLAAIIGIIMLALYLPIINLSHAI